LAVAVGAGDDLFLAMMSAEVKVRCVEVPTNPESGVDDEAGRRDERRNKEEEEKMRTLVQHA
jgi:hypothetical protein